MLQAIAIKAYSAEGGNYCVLIKYSSMHRIKVCSYSRMIVRKKSFRIKYYKGSVKSINKVKVKNETQGQVEPR